MGPQVAIGDEKKANMGPTSLKKGVRKGSKSETLEKLKIELSPGRELSSAYERKPRKEPQNWVAHRKHKNDAQKVLQNLKWTPKGPKVDPQGAKMETSLTWRSLGYEPPGG